MNKFNYKVIKGLVNHYQNCVAHILMDQSIKDKNKAIEELNDDFDTLMDEVEECESLDEVRLCADRPITYYCSIVDWELLISSFED